MVNNNIVIKPNTASILNNNNNISTHIINPTLTKTISPIINNSHVYLFMIALIISSSILILLD